MPVSSKFVSYYKTHDLNEVVSLGIAQSSNYTPEDIFWGQLGGCLEMLDAGTTTVVDHAHMNYSPDHGEHLPLTRPPGQELKYVCDT